MCVLELERELDVWLKGRKEKEGREREERRERKKLGLEVDFFEVGFLFIFLHILLFNFFHHFLL